MHQLYWLVLCSTHAVIVAPPEISSNKWWRWKWYYNSKLGSLYDQQEVSLNNCKHVLLNWPIKNHNIMLPHIIIYHYDTILQEIDKIILDFWGGLNNIDVDGRQIGSGRVCIIFDCIVDLLMKWSQHTSTTAWEGEVLLCAIFQNNEVWISLYQYKDHQYVQTLLAKTA